MVQTARVSVVIAAYNHQDFIVPAISSVLNQTFTDIEVIVVDDGSTDKTVQSAQTISDKRLQIYALEQNRAVHVRNLGISKSQSPYIAFQNSDDLWDPNKLQAQVEYLDSHPEVSACFTEVGFIDEKSKVKHHGWAQSAFTSENRPSSSWLRHFFDHGNCLCISSAVVRRASLEQVGGFLGSLVQLSDFDLWIRLAAVGELYIIPSQLTMMRIVAKKNFSFPSDKVTRRSQFELVTVLGQYVREPVVSKLAHIFPEIMKSADSDICMAALARYAWQKDLAPYALFADGVLATQLDHPDTRSKLVEHFGSSIISDFLAWRTRYNINLSTR